MIALSLRRYRFRNHVRALLAGLLVILGFSAPAHANLGEFDRTLHAWLMPEARAQFDQLSDSLARSMREAELLFYEARYDDAVAAFDVLLAQDELSDRQRAKAEELHGLATRAGRIFSDALTIQSPSGHFEVVFANPKDEILGNYLFQTLEKAYERVGAAVGVKPNHPVRFEILDDPAQLADVTQLPLDSVYTTGTVGITKYARVMMVSPRVLIQGYSWLDTAVHEYVHYLVTMRTYNGAPVWLQEGMAKLFETRWRLDEHEPLSPGTKALIKQALDNDELVTLEEMHPSIALLPSQERAALAYAEVKTMLEFLEVRSGSRGVGTMLDRVAEGSRADEALAAAFGASFAKFHEQWKQRLARLSSNAGKHKFDRKRFREKGEGADRDDSLHGDIFSHLRGGRARQHARLGVLLQLRSHKRAALLEYEKARAVDEQAAADPRLSRRMGELYLEFSQYEQAAALLIRAAEHDQHDPNLAAAEALARLRTGDREGARLAVDRAVQINPFVPRIHCVLADIARDAAQRKLERSHCR